MSPESWITVRMTTSQRACTLRAIHARRTEIVGTIERLSNISPADSNTKIEIESNRMELACLQDVTRALWGDLS